MRGGKRSWPGRTSKHVVLFVAAALFAVWAVGGTVGAAAFGTGSTGMARDVPGTLSAAVHAALTAGPAAGQAERQQQRRELAELQKGQAYKPMWQITAGAGAGPGLGADAALSMNWALSDSLSMRWHVPVGTGGGGSGGTGGGSGGGTGAGGQRLIVSWAQPLWPAAHAGLVTEMERLETYIAALSLQQHMLDTVERAVALSYEVQQAAADVAISTQAMQLAQDKMNHAQQMYEHGLVALEGWQREQQQYRQSQQAWQRAAGRQLEAYVAWLDLTGGTAAPVTTDEMTMPQLHDDVPWDAWAAALMDALGVPHPPPTPQRPLAVQSVVHGDRWESALLAHSSAYQRALLNVKQREAALNAAHHDMLPSLRAEGQISHSLQAEPVQWAVGVRATWDLGPKGPLQRHQSELDLAEAVDGLEAARETALAAGRALWIGVSDALYGVQLAEEVLEQALAAEDIVRRRVAAGLAPAADEHAAQLDVARHRLALTTARQQLNLAWLRLGHGVGVSVVPLPR